MADSRVKDKIDIDLKQLLHILFVLGINPSSYIKVYKEKRKNMAQANKYFLGVNRLSGQLCIDYGIRKNSNKEILYSRIIEDIENNVLKVFHIGGKGYPRHLENIYIPPPVLFYRGGIKLDGFNIAVVGSRKCTRYGKDAAAYISRNLSGMGITVVSGLALGIDRVAHESSIREKGKTIAVMGSGPDTIYPPENKMLCQDILEQGAVITEFPPGTPPLRQNFPIRNRIISGISRGVIIVEAGIKSGAMITGKTALEQDREVFAIPGSIFSKTSRGCHRLIKSGAKLVDSIDDILEEFQALFKNRQEITGNKAQSDRRVSRHPEEKSRKTINGKPGIVYKNISYNAVGLEELISICSLPANEVLNAITILEMGELIKEGPSNHYSRCD
jgi:DNA processing protein